MATARTGTAALVCLVVGPLLAFLRIVPPIAGFVLFGLSGLLALAALIVGGVTATRRSASAATANLAIGVALVALFGVVSAPGRQVPRINDITTDTTNPPTFVTAATLPENAGRDLSYPGATFAEQQRQGYPDLQPLALASTPEESFARATAVAKTVPDWQITRVDAQQHAIEGFAESRLFHFRDDFVVEVRPSPGGTGSVIQMRSKSRVGKGDVGANAARIRGFFAAVQGGTTR